jgi:hypothetical protein
MDKTARSSIPSHNRRDDSDLSRGTTRVSDPELHDRTDIRVNEGGAGGKVNR